MVVLLELMAHGHVLFLVLQVLVFGTAIEVDDAVVVLVLYP